MADRSSRTGTADATPGGKPSLVGPLAVDARGAAAMFGLSRAGWLKLRAQGRTPEPRRLLRRVLWDTAELREWWAAGAPPRGEWASRKGGSA
jgi:predicted DNA-binding transcriptional regulator AlpA